MPAKPSTPMTPRRDAVRRWARMRAAVAAAIVGLSVGFAPSHGAAQGDDGGVECAVDACERRYRSFRESDCTFQPNRGPRRRCELTDEGAETGPVDAALDGDADCNVAACDAAYRSFRASDCSFQPFDGPRRRCPIPIETAADVDDPADGADPIDVALELDVMEEIIGEMPPGWTLAELAGLALFSLYGAVAVGRVLAVR